MTREDSRPARDLPLFQAKSHLILASGSPRRKQFFLDLGIEFQVQAAEVEEKVGEDESPEHFVKRLSQEKAFAVARKNKDSWVIGADTVVVLNNIILGKPVSRADAYDILNMLNGKWHEVWTGFSICIGHQSVRVQKVVKTEVLFFNSSKELLQAYVSSGEPLDKAGAYGIQGIGGVLVEKIRGSYSNVVGLPLAEVVNSLMHLGVIQPVTRV